MVKLQWLQLLKCCKIPWRLVSHFEWHNVDNKHFVDSIVQDCSITIANALEILQVFHWTIDVISIKDRGKVLSLIVSTVPADGLAPSLVQCTHKSGTWKINTLRPRQNDCHLQMTFSSASSWMKIFILWHQFHRKLFPKDSINEG